MSADYGDNFDMVNVSAIGTVLEAGEYDVENFAFNVHEVGNGGGVVPFLATQTETGAKVIWVGSEVTGITTTGVNDVTYAGQSFILDTASTIYAGFTQDDFGYSDAAADVEAAPPGFLGGTQVGFAHGGSVTVHSNLYDPAVLLPNNITIDLSVGDELNLADASAPNLERTYAFEINVAPSSDQIAGDANGDGKVDGSDVTILAGNWQAGVGAPNPNTVTWEMGDFNGDGQVDGSDVTILAGNWQYGVMAAAAAVPEPSTIILLIGAIAGLLAWRRVR